MQSKQLTQKKYFELITTGHYIDVQNAENEWVMARVLEKDKKYLWVVFDGSTKKQQQYFVNSHRVAPLRTRTEGFTGSYLKISRNSMPRVQDLKNYIEIAQQKFFNQKAKSFQITQLLRGQLFVYVHDLLCRQSVLNQKQVEEANNFLELFMNFLHKTISKAIEYQDEYFASPLATSKLLYLTNPKIAIVQSLQQLLILLQLIVKADAFKFVNLWKYNKNIRNQENFIDDLLKKKGLIKLYEIYIANDKKGQWYPSSTRKFIYKILLKYSLSKPNCPMPEMPKYLARDFQQFYTIFPFMWRCQPSLDLESQYVDFSVNILLTNSPFDAKLKSIQQLRKIFEGKNKFQFLDQKKVLTKIDQMGVLEQLLDNKNFNPQVFKRFVPILSVLCKIRSLSLKNIQSLFQIVKFRHQSETGIIFDIISEISQFAPSSLLDNVYTQICKIDINSEQTMKFIKTFTIKAVENLSKQKSILGGFFGRKKGGSSKYGYYGLNILYKQSHDDGRISKQKILFALNIIKQLLSQNTLKEERWNHINFCVDFIKAKKNFGQSIKLISLILLTYDEASYFAEDRKKVIDKIEAKCNLTELIMLGFKNIETIPQIKFTHEECYQNFYDLVQTISPYIKVPLTISQIEFLWYKCDSVALLNFLRKPRPNQKFKKLLSPEAIEEIFTVIFKKGSFYKRNLTYQQFETIHQLFVSYHLEKGNIVMPSKDSLVRYVRPNLLGMDYFINFLQHTKDETTFDKAAQKTIEIILRPSLNSKKDNFIIESNAEMKAIVWRDFFKRCIERLLTNPKKCLLFIQQFYLLIEGRFFKEIKSEDTSSCQILVKMNLIQKKILIERFSTIFKLRKLIKQKFSIDSDFNMFNVKMNKVISFEEEEDFSVNAMPLVDSGRSVSIEVYLKNNRYHQQKQASLMFKNYIENEEKLYSMIFKIIEDKELSPQIEQMFWKTIQLLPLNQGMMAEVQKCDSFTLQKWMKYFQAASESSLQYKLSIVLSLIKNIDKWVIKMEENHGLLALTFTLIKILQQWNHSIENQTLLAKILDVIYQTYEKCPNKTLQTGVVHELNQNIIKTLENQFSENSQNSMKKQTLQMNLINKLMAIHSQNVKILSDRQQSVVQRIKLNTCMKLLQFGTFIKRAAEGQKKFAEQITKIFAITIQNWDDKKKLVEFLISHLNVENLLLKERTNNYFNFIHSVFTSLETSKNKNTEQTQEPKIFALSQFLPSLKNILLFIQNVLDSEFLNDVDQLHEQIQYGALNLLKFMLKKADQGFQLDQKPIFQRLVQSFLFPSNRSCFKRLKSQRNKKILFEILKKISFQNPQILTIMTDKLIPVLQKSKFRKNSILNWNLHFQNSQKKLFVGLQNLGATCYINCLFQQLFMIQSFRQNFMSIQSKSFKPELDKNQIYQLQKIFYTLKYGNRIAESTKNFCASFITFEGQPISPVVQSDADEFFNTLMDRIESFLKLTSHHDILQKTFQGQLSNQLNCEGCPHRSEKIEPFMSIGVNLKNKKTLQEALKGYVEGQTLDGDNAYYCEPCDKKVRTLKRLCIKELPNILVIVLKRFEYDFDTYKKIKINSYLEFPQTLNMTEYTSEYLESKSMEKVSVQNSEQNEKIKNDKNKIFHLRGTVIHAGYADAGHYYSFIKNKDKWYEFNDEFIRQIKYSKIKQEGFGGEDKDSSDEIKVQNYKNAYILFYERESPQNLPQMQVEKIVDTSMKEQRQNINPSPIVPYYDDMKNRILSQNYQTSIFQSLMDQNFVNFWQNLSILENLSINKFIFLYFHTVLMRDKMRHEYATNYFRILTKCLSQQSEKDKGKITETAEWYLKQINKAYIKEFLIQSPKTIRFALTSLALTAIYHARQIPDELLVALISTFRKTGMSPFGQIIKSLLKRPQVEVKLKELRFYEILTDMLFNEKKIEDIPQPQMQVDGFFGRECSEAEIQKQKCSVALLECLQHFQGLTTEMILKVNETYSFRKTNKTLLRRLANFICLGVDNGQKNESDLIAYIKMFEERVSSTNCGKEFVEKYLFFIRYLVWESKDSKIYTQIQEFVATSAQNFIISYARHYEPMDWIIRELTKVRFSIKKIAKKSVQFTKCWKKKIQQNSNLKLEIQTWLKQIEKSHYINLKDDFFEKLRNMDLHDKSQYLKDYSNRMKRITQWMLESIDKFSEDAYESDFQNVKQNQTIQIRNKVFRIRQKFDQGILYLGTSQEKQDQFLWIYLEKNEIQTFNNL